MRALVIGASLLVATLGAAAPAAQAQVVLPPGFPPQPIGYGGAPPPYGYYPSPYGQFGSMPPYGSTGLSQSSVCIDPTSGQQLVLQSANVPDSILSTCIQLPPGQ